MCGDQSLDLDWDGDTFDAGDRAARVLDVAGSLDTSDQRVVLFVVNRTENEETEAEIRLAAGRFEGEAQISVVNGPEIYSVNTFESPDTVGVSSKKVPVDGETWQHVFEPHSVTVLSCPVRR
jgi:alpha-L-arabinofuranosidase